MIVEEDDFDIVIQDDIANIKLLKEDAINPFKKSPSVQDDEIVMINDEVANQENISSRNLIGN
jgi:hypothetical protein